MDWKQIVIIIVATLIVGAYYDYKERKRKEKEKPKR